MVYHFCVGSLGIRLRDETRLDQMCLILEELHVYVPDVVSTLSFVADGGEVDSYADYELFQVPFGGDQRTATRSRGARDLRSNDETSKKSLEGLLSVIEDWHGCQTLVKVNQLRISYSYYVYTYCICMLMY